MTYNNASHNFESIKSSFEGTHDTNKATHVKISEIKKEGGADAEAGTLKYKGAEIQADTVIEIEALNQLVWDASKAVGGSFKFTAVQADGKAFTNAPAAQTVTINEAAYVPAPEEVTVSQNTIEALDKNRFDFSVDGKAEAPFIKITAIENKPDELSTERVVRTTNADQNAVKTAYQVVQAGAEGITLQDAKTAAEKLGGELLEISDQEELNWLKSGDGILGKLNLSSITVASEATDVKNGAWFTNPDSNAVSDANDKEGIIAGEDSTNELQFVDHTGTKLTAYVVEFANYNSQKPGLLLASPQDSDPKTAVEAGKVLSADEQGKLSWDSMFNNGGSIKFVEVTTQEGTTHAEGAAEKTIEISEGPAATKKSFDAGHILGVTTPIDEQTPPVI